MHRKTGSAIGARLSRKEKESGREWTTVFALVVVFVGGLLSVGAWVGLGIWTGLFLMAVGAGFLIYRYNQTTVDSIVEDRARAAAATEQRPFSELVNDALKEYLKSRYP